MSYEKSEIFKHVDHTNLSVTMQEKELYTLISDAERYGTASICIPSSIIKTAKDIMDKEAISVPICTVVGFPHGNCNTVAKVAETKQALIDGAEEIDMVINISALKNGNVDYVFNEIKAISNECKDKSAILKVIVETCYLNESEIRTMCNVCATAGADFIKTSTGFGTSGATREVVSIMADEIKKKNLNLKIKAAGGIRTRDDMEWYLAHNCSRLGTSSAIKILCS